MEFIVFIIALILAFSSILILNYFRKLFGDGRDEYARSELLDIRSSLLAEWQSLSRKNEVSTYIGLFLGIMLGFICSYLGGQHGLGSYIFHSALVPVLFYFIMSLLREKFESSIDKGSLLVKLIGNDIPFIVGICAAVIAQNVTHFLTQQNINFLWVIINILLIIGMVIYRFYRADAEPEYAEATDIDDIDTSDEINEEIKHDG